MNVNFPDKVWARLARLADEREMKIADLLVESVDLILDNKAPKPPAPASSRRVKQALDWDEVARLHGEGLSDSAIARLMGRPANTVFNARRRMHLPSNYGPGGRPINPKGKATA